MVLFHVAFLALHYFKYIDGVVSSHRIQGRIHVNKMAITKSLLIKVLQECNKDVWYLVR